MTSAMTSPHTSMELFLPNAMANLKDLNDGGELTSVITCRVPADMKGDAIKAAAKEKLTLSQWMALLVERALDPKNSLLVGRDDLENSRKRAATAEAQVKKLTDRLQEFSSANTNWQKAHEKAIKTAQDAKTVAQMASKKASEFEARLRAANEHLKKNPNFLEKPKQF